jgi:ribosomal protein L11 methyltransferase
MAWIQIRLSTSSEQAEVLSDALMVLGAVSVTFEDSEDVPIYEPMPGESPLWQQTTVVGLFDALTDMAGVAQALQKLPCADQVTHTKIEALEDKDWTRAWMDDFHPMQFGRRLWICPSWREAPEPDAVNVMLDPGLAFGTGTHPTTALCLRWLDSLELNNKTVIDFGCGSGILAIAALKLGAQKVIGIDIDPQAIEASIENATRNQVIDRLETYLPEQTPQGLQADVVVANILAGPLLELAPLIADYVKSGGQLVLSGLLQEQAEEVREHYSQWFVVDTPDIDQEWVRLTAVRK